MPYRILVVVEFGQENPPQAVIDTAKMVFLGAEVGDFG
jgi:hypothetical protein